MLRKAFLCFLAASIQITSVYVLNKVINMDILQSMEKCNGCGACYNVCPFNAIIMQKDNEGFWYPHINDAKCVECGLCKKTCPIEKKLASVVSEVYAAKYDDDNVRLDSASGGAFSLFSDLFLNDQSVVYGVAFDEHFVARHIRATSKLDRNRMRGSKYVQAESFSIFSKVKEDLENGMNVLFCGTPCQVAGLLGYLKKPYDKLLTIDIICHGVMSPKIFKEYIEYIKRKYGDITSFTFRDKSIAWRGCHISVEVQDKKISETIKLNVAKQLYYGHYATRKSCHVCHFTSVNRVSDITIGDFWGIEKNNPSFEDSRGVSLIMINTEKGRKTWDKCNKNCIYIEEDIKNCNQPQLYEPSKPNLYRNKFWKDYEKGGFTLIAKTYGGAGIIAQTKKKIKLLIRYNRI